MSMPDTTEDLIDKTLEVLEEVIPDWQLEPDKASLGLIACASVAGHLLAHVMRMRENATEPEKAQFQYTMAHHHIDQMFAAMRTTTKILEAIDEQE